MVNDDIIGRHDEEQEKIAKPRRKINITQIHLIKALPFF